MRCYVEVEEMKTTSKVNINNAVLNLIQIDSLEEIIEGMVNEKADFFEKKYKQKIEEVRKTRFVKRGNVGAEVLFILKKKHKVEGKTVGMYRNILIKELFIEGEQFIEYFQEKFLMVLNYHFNVRRVYGITLESSVEEIKYEAIEKFTGIKPVLFKNTLIGSIDLNNNDYIAIYNSENEVKIVEKLGITSVHNKGSEKAVFVQYVIDTKNDFFEISYNDSVISDFCKQEKHEKIISIQSNDEVSIEKKFATEATALMNLYNRVKNIMKDVVLIHSISKGLSSSQVNQMVSSIKENENVSDNDIEIIANSEQEAFNKSPFEAAMYQYFKEDREKLLKQVLEEETLNDNEKFKEILAKDFPEIDSSNLITSVKFLKNMIAFSKLKQNKHVVNNFEDFIFYFTVRDFAVTKSTTKNNERKPVYTSDFYWHLQEVIDSIKLLTELGLRKSVEIYDKKISQEVKISHYNDHLNFVYFQFAKKNSTASKEKNILKLAESRFLIHELIKTKFREIVSRESGI